MLYITNQFQNGLLSCDAGSLGPSSTIPAPGKCYRVQHLPQSFFFGDDSPFGDEKLLVATGTVGRRRSSFVSLHSADRLLKSFTGMYLPQRDVTCLALVQGTALDSSPLVLAGGAGKRMTIFKIGSQRRNQGDSIEHQMDTAASVVYVHDWPGQDVIFGGSRYSDPHIVVADLLTRKIVGSSVRGGWFPQILGRSCRSSGSATVVADPVRHSLFSAHPQAREVMFWDFRIHPPQRHGYVRLEGRPLTLAFAADLNSLLIGCSGSIDVFDCRKGCLRERRVDLMGVEAFARIDRFTFAAATYSRGIGIFDVARGVEQRAMTGSRGCTGICFVGDDFENEQMDEDERLSFWIGMCQDSGSGSGVCSCVPIRLVSEELLFTSASFGCDVEF